MDEMDTEPNIFEYATSEFSQDAFICWALDGLNYPKSTIHQFSKAFLDRMLDKYASLEKREKRFSSSDVVKATVQKQYDFIDIFVTLDIRTSTGKIEKETLIIEDKVYSSIHSDQLFRYKNKFKDLNPVSVLYKSDFLFDDQMIAYANGYTVGDLRDLCSLLEKFSSTPSDILKGYQKSISKRNRQVEEFTNDPLHQLNDHIGQYILMRRWVPNYFEEVVREADYKKGTPPVFKQRLEMGRNTGGSPWTHYTLLFKEDDELIRNQVLTFENCYIDTIFCRIDCNSKGYYFSINQYNREHLDKLTVRLPYLRKRFIEAIDKIVEERIDRMPKLELKKYFTLDNRGTYESKIAVVQLDHLTEQDIVILKS